MSEYRGIDLIQDPDRKAWNKRTGWTITRPFRGSQERVEQGAEVALLSGDTFEIVPGADGLNWELLITFGAEETQSTSEPLSDNWDRVINSLEKELWELPFVRDGFIAIYNAIIAAGLPEETAIDCVNWVRKNVELYIQGNTEKIKDLGGDEFDLTFANLVAHITTTGVNQAAVANWLKRITRLHARGVKSFPLSQYVLRRSRVLASNFDWSNLANIDDDLFKRRTTEELKTVEPIPTRFYPLLPPGEWVKQSATVRQMSSTKDEVVEEWWHADLWEQEIYGDPI